MDNLLLTAAGTVEVWNGPLAFAIGGLLLLVLHAAAHITGWGSEA